MVELVMVNAAGETPGSTSFLLAPSLAAIRKQSLAIGEGGGGERGKGKVCVWGGEGSCESSDSHGRDFAVVIRDLQYTVCTLDCICS